jgi:hypothetical protein
MTDLTNCAHCQKQIDLDKDAQTWCPVCNKDFCFSLWSSCFSEYHLKNNLRGDHRAHSISDPTWTVNLVQKGV